jgi:UDP-N-acetylglucosamine 2-epimerase (non-hydrolysing)
MIPGIQEETTYLNIPCLTLAQYRGRDHHEGTNELTSAVTKQSILSDWKQGKLPVLWDKDSASR